MISRRAFSLAAGAGLLAGTARAQDKYPSQMVRIFDGYTAGGGTDALARYLGSKTSAATVVVENRPGASGQIAMGTMAKAKADGYTLMVMPNELVSVTPLLYKQLPFNVQRDVVPVATLADLPLVLTVNPKVDAKDVRELVAMARQRPGKVSFGSAGSGTTHHLSLELFNALAGVQILHVPYKGTSAAVNDLLSGQIDGVFSPITAVLPHIRAGKLRALAVAGGKRVTALPDTPTVAEAGVRGYESPLWILLSGPAGMPQEVSDFWIAHSKAVFSTDDARNVFGSQGVEPLSLTQAQMRQRLADDNRRWAKIIESAKITVG